MLESGRFEGSFNRSGSELVSICHTLGRRRRRSSSATDPNRTITPADAGSGTTETEDDRSTDTLAKRLSGAKARVNVGVVGPLASRNVMSNPVPGEVRIRSKRNCTSSRPLTPWSILPRSSVWSSK